MTRAVNRVWRRAAAVLVTTVGVAAIVATGPPPPPELRLSSTPALPCRGETVTLSWSFGPSDHAPPDSFELIGSPADAFDPPLGETVTGATGERTLTVRAPAFVGADHPSGLLWWQPLGIDAVDCDALGLQEPIAERSWVALAADPTGTDLIGATLPLTEGGTSHLRRWSPSLVAGAPIAIDGVVRAVAVAADGRLGVTGAWRDPDAEGTVTTAFTAVLAADGTELWRDDLALPPDGVGDGSGLALAFAADGGLVVAGTRPGTGSREGFVRRYDDQLDLAWDHTLTARLDVEARAVTIDAGGGVHVAGESRGVLDAGDNIINPRAFLRRLDADGVEQWTEHRDRGFGQALAPLDGDHMLLVAGRLTAFETDGAEAWNRAATSRQRFVLAVPDGSGGAFLASQVTVDPFGRGLVPHVDVQLERIDAAGTLLAAQHIGSLDDETAIAMSAWPAAGSGGLAVAGTTFGSLLDRRPEGREEPDAFLFVLEVD